MLRRHAAVAPDVEVPSGFGGDDADVLATGLRALAGTPRHAHLDLVRCAQPPVAQFEVDRHLHRILLAVAAPVAADAALHGAQRLAVRLTGFHAAVDEPAPDLRQLVHAGAEHVDALPAGDLGVQPEVAGDLTDEDQLLGGDVAAGNPRYHRVAAVLLDVGKEVVVGVLQRGLLAVEDVVGARRRQDGGHDGFADIATTSGAVAGDEAREGPDLGGGDGLEQLGTGLAEVLAQRLRLLDTLGLEQLLEQRHARATGGACERALLQAGNVGATAADGFLEVALRDVVAGADLRDVGQRAHAQTRRGPVGCGHDQRQRITRQLARDHRAQHAVGGCIADQDAAEQRLGVIGEHQLGVGLLHRVVDDDVEAVGGAPLRVSEAGDVDAEELELRGHVGVTELGLTPEQAVGDHLGAGVAGADQAVAASFDRGHLADRIDAGIACHTCGIGQDPTALRQLQTGLPTQFVARPDACCEDHQAGLQTAAVVE